MLLLMISEGEAPAARMHIVLATITTLAPRASFNGGDASSFVGSAMLEDFTAHTQERSALDS